MLSTPVKTQHTIFANYRLKWIFYSVMNCHDCKEFQGYGLFSLRLIGSAMLGATFNLKLFPTAVANADNGSLKSLHTFLKNVCTTFPKNLTF